MTYGYQQGGSFGSHKQALGFDAAASDQLRTQAALKEQRRIMRDRAKAQLADFQRKLTHNKTEISNKEVEARRLIAEATHAIHELQGVDQEIKALEEKERTSKRKANEASGQVQQKMKDTVHERKDLEEENKNVEQLERQIARLEEQENGFKKKIADDMAIIQKSNLELKKLESEVAQLQAAAARANSERLYKIKDIDNKKRAIQAMDQKRVREIGEIQRLKAENIHLETQIKQLESVVKESA